MAERSKELLHLEHKATPLSSLESTLLVCNGKREQCTQTKILPPNGTPLTSIPKSQRPARTAEDVQGSVATSGVVQGVAGTVGDLLGLSGTAWAGKEVKNLGKRLG
ncbi:hypothetical protein Ahy_B04g070264 isoform C [Arachis hypogaea]|uniref:Uncharacterized protein n=1 Tax=Arachis hypogaea TaxID=3818 RepID=A0A444ZFW3_ARAHY|nr:hypothetical protein Ahy_B04g070264 isoform C [Arachis hypogaea]